MVMFLLKQNTNALDLTLSGTCKQVFRKGKTVAQYSLKE